MTWIDVALILIWGGFVALGSRLGSVWTAACFIGGFLGAFIADYYSYPVAQAMGGFGGAQVLAAVLLFVVGVVCGLALGMFLEKVAEASFTQFADSIFGFTTGALAGFLALALILLWTVQLYADIEDFNGWQKSRIARPLYGKLEGHFEKYGFQSVSFSRVVKRETTRRVTPLAGKAVEKAKNLSEDVVDRLKKE